MAQASTELEMAGATVDKIASSESIVLNCKDCGHCRDIASPNRKDSKDLIRERARIIKWLEAFIKQ